MGKPRSDTSGASSLSVLGTHRGEGRSLNMRSTPEQCREHADHCRKMAEDAPPALAREFESLAATWLRLAGELERAEAFRPDVLPNVIPLERARR